MNVNDNLGVPTIICTIWYSTNHSLPHPTWRACFTHKHPEHPDDMKLKKIAFTAYQEKPMVLFYGKCVWHYSSGRKGMIVDGLNTVDQTGKVDIYFWDTKTVEPRWWDVFVDVPPLKLGEEVGS